MILSAKRRIVQVFSLVALNVNIWGASLLKVGCLPVMNCEACVVSWLGCPVGMLARAIVFVEIPWLMIGCLLAVGVLMGRMMCGWVCPFGFIQDLLYKIPKPKFKIPHFLTWFKYGFLLIGVVGAVLIFGDDYEFKRLYFCNYCPTAALDVVLPEMIMHQDFTFDSGRIFRFSVLVVVVFLAIANHRSFCKIMCPIGAMIAIANKFTLFSLKIKQNECISCKACNRHCPMDIDVESRADTGKAINRDLECIECLTCEQKCPEDVIANNAHI